MLRRQRRSRAGQLARTAQALGLPSEPPKAEINADLEEAEEILAELRAEERKAGRQWFHVVATWRHSITLINTRDPVPVPGPGGPPS